MKVINIKQIFFIVIYIFLFSCDDGDDVIIPETNSAQNINAKIYSDTPFNMLWNKDGVKKRSFLHLNLNDGQADMINNPPIRNLCDLSEADNVGNMPNTWPYSYLTTQGYIQSPNKTAYSFKLVSEGYSNSQYGTYGGFSIWVQNGNMDIPLEFKMINSAKQLSQNKKLHEVGIIFEHWYNQWDQGRWSFKEQYYIDELKYIKLKFDVRLDHFNNYQSPNTTLTTTYLTADLRIEYRRIDDGSLQRTDLLGVIFSNLGGLSNGFDFNGNMNDNIFWIDTNPANPRVLLHGYKLGLGIPNITNISSNFTTIEFDYKPLIAQYLPAPPNGCKAILVGLDIYSSTRCADIDFSVKNIYLNGMYD